MRHLIQDAQSVLVSKKLYPTEHEAMRYVESLGKNAHFKIHPHSTQSFWRFRQHNPIENAKYITQQIAGGKVIRDIAHHYQTHHPVQHHIQKIITHQKIKNHLGKEGHLEPQVIKSHTGTHHQFPHSFVGQHKMEKPIHIPNMLDMGGFKIDQNLQKHHVDNIVREQPKMVGQNGAGIWKREYWTPEYKAEQERLERHQTQMPGMNGGGIHHRPEHHQIFKEPRMVGQNGGGIYKGQYQQ